MTTCSDVKWGEFEILTGFGEKVRLFREKEELFNFLTGEFAKMFSTSGSVVLMRKEKAPDWALSLTRRISAPMLSSLSSFAHERCARKKPAGNLVEFPRLDGGELMLCIGEDGPGDCVLFLLKDKRNDWNEKELSLLTLLASQISLSVENLLLRERIEGTTTCTRANEDVGGLHDLIGESFAMREVFHLIETVKETRSTALITGETGTGKELIARAIHFLGSRHERPFVAHNCGATPDTLIESELFGHTRGSFTGAAQDKKGLFEIADGGTFFLDEIADMSPMMQIRVLRVLQEGEFRRIGETRSRKVDVRIIAATNKNLENEIANGSFRADLFYRLNVVRIAVPPLRDRIADVPVLSEHFREKSCLRSGKEVGGFSTGAMEVLTGYSWPGNVRELENEVERAVLLTPAGAVIMPEIFTETLQAGTSPVCGRMHLRRGSLKEARGRMERSFVLETLSKHNGNKTRAAKELGLTRQGLIKKLKGFGQLPLFE